MIPALAVLGYTALLLGLGYGWSRTWKRAEAAEWREAEACTDVLGLMDDLAGATRDLTEANALKVSGDAEIRDLQDDLEWARVMHAVSEGQADRHAAHHACLPGIEAIRAGEVDVAGEGPAPVYEAARVALVAPVLPIKKGGRK